MANDERLPEDEILKAGAGPAPPAVAPSRDSDRYLRLRRSSTDESLTAERRTADSARQPRPAAHGPPGLDGGDGLAARGEQALRRERSETDQRLRDERQASDQVLARHRTRDDVLQQISHELRTPLQVVTSSAAFLTQIAFAEQNGARVQRAADNIQRATARMTRFVDDLLDAARIEAGRLELEVETHLASNLVHEALTVLGPLAEEKGLDLELEVASDARVRCDSARVFQVFQNLIGNAVKFTESGSIRVRIRELPEWVHFEVQDSGPGVPPDDCRRVFERHWQGASAYRRSGAGLGLFIVQGIVSAHGGRVECHAPPEGGALFGFGLPRA